MKDLISKEFLTEIILSSPNKCQELYLLGEGILEIESINPSYLVYYNKDKDLDNGRREITDFEMMCRSWAYSKGYYLHITPRWFGIQSFVVEVCRLSDCSTIVYIPEEASKQNTTNSFDRETYYKAMLTGYKYIYELLKENK